MRCLYCEVEVTEYPSTGICPRCGAKLPPKPVQTDPQPNQPSISQGPLYAGKDCCPKCHSSQIIFAKRGFRWGLALIGFLCFSLFGLPMGFIGSKHIWGTCSACGHKWDHSKY